MIALLYVFLVLAALKLTINLYRYFQAKRYIKLYTNHIHSPSSDLFEQKNQIVRLLREAGIDNGFLLNGAWAGYGQLATGNISMFKNLTPLRGDVTISVSGMLCIAKGTFRARAVETLNPLYWVEFIIHLPKRLLNYLGVSAESVVIRLAQLIHWLFAFVRAFSFAMFRPDLELLARSWFSILR